MIKLYYIDGINDTDEPVFTGILSQQRFFNNNVVATIDNSFYPPHYSDVIALSSDDVDFNTSFNYLSINFNNKEYYYFIDAVEYVNEDLMNVTIRMDDIQTSMFNIYITNGTLSRKSIARWDGGAINRDYLRENMSSGIFVKDVFEETTSSIGSGYVIVSTTHITNNGLYYTSTTADVDYGNITTLVSPTINNHTSTESVPLSYIFVPVPTISTIDTFGFGTKTANKSYQRELLRRIVQMTQVVDCFFVNNIADYCDNISVDANGNYTFDDGVTGYKQLVAPEQYNRVGYFINFGSVGNNTTNLKINTLTHTIKPSINEGYTISRGINNRFDIKYCPQLIDSNYYHIYFGEKTEYTEYPIEKLDTPQLYTHAFFSLIYQKRTYWITDTADIVDFYLTAKSCDGNLSYVTQNNALNDWLAISKGTIAMSPINTFLGGLDFDSTSTHTRTMEDATTKKINVYGRKPTNDGVSSRISKIGSTTTKSGGGYTDVTSSAITGVSATTGLSLIGSVANATGDMVNKIFTPNTMKQSPTCDLFNEIPNTFLIQYKVNDLEDVAKLHESLGYSVHETYSGIADWGYHWNIRYYYNVICFSDINVTFKPKTAPSTIPNMVCDRETIERIEQRFKDGLRLWNTTSGLTPTTHTAIGNMWEYDNVENSEV